MVPSNYFTKNYIKHALWAQMWREALRVGSDVVDDGAQHVERVKGDIVPAARETLKYSVKPADMTADPGWLLEITRQLHRLRFIAAGGLLKHVLRQDEEKEADLLVLNEGEADGADADPEAEVFFGWRRHEKRYTKEQARKPHDTCR
jgi:hypothetical protein